MKRRGPQPASYRRLDQEDDQGATEGKAIILHGFSPAQVQELVALYRGQDDLPQDVAFAMVTEESARRRLGDVVTELREEAKAARERRSNKGRENQR